MKIPEIYNVKDYCEKNNIEKQEYDDFGYFAKYKRRKIKNLIEKYKVKTIIELGTLLGKSAIYMSQFGTVENIYCVDFFRINVQYFTRPYEVEKYKINEKEVSFFNEFLSNCLHSPSTIHKINFVRSSTEFGLFTLYKKNIDKGTTLVYIDAGHSYHECYADLELSHQYFPHALLCADDYTTHIGVKKAVDDFMVNYNVKVYHD